MTFKFEAWSSDELGWDQDTGVPGVQRFGDALQVWALMQIDREKISVAEAAQVFNVEPTRIIEAVEEHFYMYLDGPQDDYSRLMIEHDGE